VQGTNSVNTLYAGVPTYIDWSVVNDGNATASGRLYNCLYFDGGLIGRWYVDNLQSGYYTYVTDWAFVVNTSGNHTLRLSADCTGVAGESNETDNIWERTFTWNPDPNAKPNLRPYQPGGWDYPIVPSSVQGTGTVNTLYVGQPTYIDWAVANVGNATANGRVSTCLYLDGTEIGRWYTDNLPAGYYTYVKDWSFTVNSTGNHTLRLTADCTGVSGESNESDNIWERTFTWSSNPNAKPNLRPYQPGGWDYPIVPSSVQGTTKVNTLYAGQPTYFDWAVVNNGTVTANGTMWNCLYLDGTEINRWYVNNLSGGYYTYVRDWSFTVKTAGTHTLKLSSDCTGAIGESNESDNVWERTFTWGDASVDTDGDGLPDIWETNGYDADGDGEIDIDLPGMGANPRHKDIFIEIDWMQDENHNHRPSTLVLNRVIDTFARAPVGNPDGTQGVTIHLDVGGLGGGNALMHQNDLGGTSWFGAYNWDAFDAIKRDNFARARQRIFHYMIFAHNLGGLGGTSGISRGIPASDFIVSLGSWTNGVGSDDEQTGTFIHELGHNLGLRHGGNDDVNFKPNYLSVMNYSFQTVGVYRDGRFGHFDYSRSLIPTLDENSLDENTGLNGGDAIRGYRTYYSCPNSTIRVIAIQINGPIDWNCDGEYSANRVSTSINSDSTRQQLGSQNNWANIRFTGGSIGASGEALARASSPQYTFVYELNFEMDRAIRFAQKQALDEFKRSGGK